MGLRIKGKEVPDRWEKCSTEVFGKIMADWEPDKPIEQRDRIKLYQILTGETYEALSQSKDSTLSAYLWTCSQFVYDSEAEWATAPPPETINWHSYKVITIPKKIGALSLGSHIHIRQALKAGTSPHSLIALACAVFLQPQIDGTEFNFDRAKELEKEFKAMPITETYPIGFFFFSKLKPYGSGFWWNLRLNLQRKMNGVRSLLNWPKAIGSMLISRLPSLTAMLKHFT